MIKSIFLVFVVCFFASVVYSQETKSKDKKKQERRERISELMKKEEEGALVYNKQYALGLKLNTDGWAAMYEHGKYKSITNTNIWWLELGERKSKKEEKTTKTSSDGFFILVGNPFIYGKSNNFYYLKAGLGQQRLIGGKGNKNGVAVSAIYGAGLSAGLLKPYYVTVSDPTTGDVKDVKYPDTLFLDKFSIVGGSGLSKGFNEVKFVPGAQAKLGLRFDYGKFNELLSAIEVGINAEYYTQKMPIMVYSPEKQFFFNAYIGLEFGKRK